MDSEKFIYSKISELKTILMKKREENSYDFETFNIEEDLKQYSNVLNDLEKVSTLTLFIYNLIKAPMYRDAFFEYMKKVPYENIIEELNKIIAPGGYGYLDIGGRKFY